MRQYLLAATALTFSSPVFAADLPAPQPMPMKAPMMAPAPAIFSWTGCYIGGHVGAGWGRTTFTDPGNFFAPTGDQLSVNQGAGVLGGGQLGCNYQIAPSWILGVEGDFSWADINGTLADPDPLFAGKNLSSKTQWLASATGRIGYGLDRWMIYGKGGAAWAHNRYDISTGTLSDFSGTDTRAGWTAGGGIEWAFAPAWSAKIEFDYYNFGSRNVTLSDPNFGTGPVPVKQDIEAVKVGINYHFGGR